MLHEIQFRGSQLADKVQFVWVNQEDNSEETSLTSAWYEVLSVLHLMAMICLSEANSLLLPTTPNNGYLPTVSEESQTASIDILLKAAGYLDCAIQHALPQIPTALRKDLPVDLAEDVLRSLCMQALGQSVDIQLGMAVDNPKATPLAVKQKLACEMGHHVLFHSFLFQTSTLCIIPRHPHYFGFPLIVVLFRHWFLMLFHYFLFHQLYHFFQCIFLSYDIGNSCYTYVSLSVNAFSYDYLWMILYSLLF